MTLFDSSCNDFETAIDIIKLGMDIKALVIGDVILDKYTYGQIDRVSTGIAIPTVEIKHRKYCLGGAVYVKGAEYRDKTLPELEYVDQIYFVETVEHMSTINIINKCKRNRRIKNERHIHKCIYAREVMYIR